MLALHDLSAEEVEPLGELDDPLRVPTLLALLLRP
jgi:hypothetical protein